MLRRMADADDVLKGAGRFFKKLGSVVADTSKTVATQVAATSKQVTGLGRGSVKLELDATKVAPGGQLKGRITLALSEPVSAKRLLVTLRARQRIVTIKRGEGAKGVSATHADVFQFDKELAPSQTFEKDKVYELTLDIPPDALDLKPQPQNASPLADVARTVVSAFNPSAGPIEWQVIGRLEIAWGRDLSSEVDIVVAP